MKTGAGHHKNTDELIDTINHVFAMFRVNFHNQYYSAFGDNNESENLAKKLWLNKLANFKTNTIYRASEKIIEDSEYLPTLNKMIQICLTCSLPKELPTAKEAYFEACNKPTPKASQAWSHPIVFLSGRDTGWSILHSQIEATAFPRFQNIFEKYRDRLAGGETFSIENKEGTKKLKQKPAAKRYNREQIKALKSSLEQI